VCEAVDAECFSLSALSLVLLCCVLPVAHTACQKKISAQTYIKQCRQRTRVAMPLSQGAAGATNMRPPMPPFRSGLQQRAEQRMAAAELATKMRLEHALRAPARASVRLHSMALNCWIWERLARDFIHTITIAGPSRNGS